jgi:A/G-specific adenine glycosylase
MPLPRQKWQTATPSRSLTERERLREFRQRLRRWFLRYQRQLPWRTRQDEYRVFVSEIMLQQTQVSRVVPIFEQFLKRFPTFVSLAHAPQRDVISAWKGLGYNRRALALQRSAKIVLREHGGHLPSDETTLRQLPGVGAYTAQAIRAFVFNEPVIALDTNAERILARYFHNSDVLARQKVQPLLKRLASLGMGRRVDAASLMDFGALVCTARTPRCSECPLRASCRSARRFLSGNVAAKTRRRGIPFRLTDRFLRGRIVDLLREKKYKKSQMLQTLRGLRPDLQSETFHRLLGDLEREGLIKRASQGGSPHYQLA